MLFDPQANKPCQAQAPKGDVIGLDGIAENMHLQQGIVENVNRFLPKIALLAGGGALPAQLIQAWQAAHRPYHIIAFKDQTPPALLENAAYSWSRLGAVENTLRLLKAHDVQEVVLAGYMRKPKLWEVFPDFTALKMLWKMGFSLKGDNKVLKTIMAELEQHGLTVRGAHELLADVLLPQGSLTLTQPNSQALHDITLGLAAAKQHGAQDLGQAVLVENGQVLGYEDAAGTDALIDRFANHTRQSRTAILIKACKPQQDTRADLPTIGKRTVEQAIAAGLQGIAGEAGKTLLLEREQAVAQADAAGVFVWGVGENG